MWSFGDDESALGQYAWYKANSGHRIQVVGQKQANTFGLHDMHGNATEWVQDVWHDNYSGAPTDGSAWVSGGDHSRRVLRGGSWESSPIYLRSAVRSRGFPDYRYGDSGGFRIARTVP
jgi:formylglycine-generating enzyme required for sulfatase activity